MPRRSSNRISDQIEQDLKSRLSAEISRLADLAPTELRSVWTAEFRKEPPKGLSRDLLLRTLAWRLQETAFGGHDAETLKLLDAHARGRGNEPMFRRLQSGTVLIREYRGVRHSVTIVNDGFIWQEKSYPNLSVIARAITGTNWNGPRFFGLREGAKNGAQLNEAVP